ncbi:MAG: hypothetical protein LQ338_004326 [Usnochroma carphineum]|nr:MAG: hypothetical protein LQ338_004326 [Usnochroma carphineum]
MQSARVLEGDGAPGISSPILSRPEPKLTDYHNQLSTKKLLPPIDLTPQVHDPTGYARRSLATHPCDGNISTATGLQDNHQPPSQVLDDVPVQYIDEAVSSAPSYHQQRPECSDTSFEQRSLQKTPGSRELRRRAGWGPVGTRGIPGADERTHSWSVTSSPDPGAIRYNQPIMPSRKPRLWNKASSSVESVEKAVTGPTIYTQNTRLTSFQQLTTVTSPSKPRLITISPRTPTSKTNSLQPATPLECPLALVSAFSPDTPPETPDVANRIDADEDPTCRTVEKHGRGSLDTKICYPMTPPNSRVPTPFHKIDKVTSSSCFRKHPRWGRPTTMNQLDPSTAWILQELEVLLADFPMTALRRSSPVIQQIRFLTSGRPVAEKSSAWHTSSVAPHSRYSPYRPVTNFSVSAPSPSQASAPQPSRSRVERSAFALRIVFPSARPQHLDSLQATYLALHYVVNLPSLEFTTASASETAASPYTVSVKHSRSSSVVSTVPPKARAMLGFESPVQTPPSPPSPIKSWFRASTPELDPELKVRLENVELLLEASIRKILIEIGGRPLGKQDDALVRAVGEVVKMGEKRSSAQVS